MSVSVTKRTTTPVARTSLVPQPYHDKIKSVQSMIQSRYHFNPLQEKGFDNVMSSESLVSVVGQTIGELIPDAGIRETYNQVYQNTMRELRDPFAGFSEEGSDAMAPSSNYNQFARLNPWSILGYIARSKCLEMYLTINSDTPTVTYEYNLSYVVKGDDPSRYFLPNAVRNGEIGGIYDLPELKIDVDLAGAAGYSHIEKFTDGGVEEAWIKLPASGNLLEESGFDPSKFAVERNLCLSKVRYKVADMAVDGTFTVNNDRHFTSGEISKRTIMTPLTIHYKTSGGDMSTFTANVMGFIDLDSGNYDLAAVGPVTHVQLWARATNMANELGTVRAGNTKIVETFDVNNHVYGTVPVAPEMTDDFNAGGEGVTFVAFMVDKLTEAFSGVRDIDMESRADKAFADGPGQHRLYPKLGGSAQSINFHLGARGAGGGDPFSWQTIGLKNTLNFMFAQAETDTYFEDNVARSWYMLGHETDVMRVPEISFTNFAGDAADAAGSAGGAFKYGFALDASAGYADNFGRRVKVIGSKYRRHLGRPMRALLKSNDIGQPTGVYLPYSFRVFSSISPEYSKRGALSVAARDYVGFLSLCQCRVQLIGNTTELYAELSRNSAGIV